MLSSLKCHLRIVINTMASRVANAAHNTWVAYMAITTGLGEIVYFFYSSGIRAKASAKPGNKKNLIIRKRN